MINPQEVIAMQRAAIGVPWHLQGRSLKTGIDCLHLGTEPFLSLGWKPRSPENSLRLNYGFYPNGDELIEGLLREGREVDWHKAEPCDCLLIQGRGMKGAYHVAWVTESSPLRVIHCRPKHPVEEADFPLHWEAWIKACIRFYGVGNG